MPVRMSKEKMDRILSLVANIKAESSNKQVLSLIDIVSICIDVVDDLQEDVLFYEDELERLRFEKQDRQLERSGINTSNRGRLRT